MSTRNRRSSLNPRNTRRILSSKNHLKAKEYIAKLRHLYPSCQFDQNRSECETEYTGHKITYGEMEYEGIQKLYGYVTSHLSHKINAFIDIGSGRGKLCMYMASKSPIVSVLGVELVRQRHHDALQLKTKLQSKYSEKVEFVNSDVLKVDFSKFQNNKVFVWFSNLCFDQSTTNDIFQKLSDELPKGTILCCSKQPMPVIGEHKTTITIPMSWSSNSSVYVYEL